jgi:hypothetical protein
VKALFNLSPDGTKTIYHENPDSPGFVLEKIFDREPVLEHCAFMRNEVVQTGPIRKAMSIPTSMFFQLMREGKLGEHAYVDGNCVVEPRALKRLMSEFSRLNCVDKL